MAKRAIGSADAVEDEWWVDGWKGEKRAAVAQDDVSTSKKRKKAPKSLEPLLHVEEEDVLYTSAIQRQKFARAMHDTLKGILTPVERDAMKIKRSHFIECSVQCAQPSLSQLLEQAIPKWEELVKALHTRGSPLVIVLSVSANRAVELRRQLVGHCKPHRVAKLFSRHMKADAQSSFLASHTTPVAVATPSRLLDLLDNDALNVDNLCAIVLDWHWKDKKLRSFSCLPEVWQSFVELYQRHFHRKVKAKQTRLLLY